MINEILPLILIYLIDIAFIYILYKCKDGIMQEMSNDTSKEGCIAIVLLIASILMMLFVNIVIIYEILVI